MKLERIPRKGKTAVFVTERMIEKPPRKKKVTKSESEKLKKELKEWEKITTPQKEKRKYVRKQEVAPEFPTYVKEEKYRADAWNDYTIPSKPTNYNIEPSAPQPISESPKFTENKKRDYIPIVIALVFVMGMIIWTIIVFENYSQIALENQDLKTQLLTCQKVSKK